jgi:enamine deaminase RidA (YjgF/YER057c/UK114 family)
MEKKTYKLYHGDSLMHWGKGTVVTGARGFVFLAGTEGQDPNEDFREGGRLVEGAAAQTRLALEKMKERLEEMGSSLDNIVKLIHYVVGPDFPDGVANHPNYRFDVMDAFFREHCPELASDRNPPTRDLIGVSGLGAKDQVVEIACIAVLPNEYRR